MLGLYQTRPGVLLRGAESVQCGGLDKERLADTQRLCFGGNGKGMSTHAQCMHNDIATGCAHQYNA